MSTIRTPPPVRDARPDDLETVIDFNLRLALESEAKELDRQLLTRGAAQALAEPDRLRYWIAELEGRAVGQAAVSREWSDWRNGWIWWIQSVYVVPERRGRGVFRSLFQHIRTVGRAAPDVVGLRLYVDDRNHSAQQTYQAMGMSPGGYHVYEDFWVECELNRGGG